MKLCSLAVSSLLLLLGLLAAEGARLAAPGHNKAAETLVKKAKAETELATKEMELSKLLEKKAKQDPAGSEAATKDEAAAKAALATGAKALEGAKKDIAEASSTKTPTNAKMAVAGSKRGAAGFLKKAKLETELAKEEVGLSKALEARAKKEPAGSAPAAKDEADAKAALAAGEKAIGAAKAAMAEAKEKMPAVESKKKPVAAKPATPVEQLDRVAQSLATLAKLKSTMTQGQHYEGQEMAEGAITTEMGKDGAVWSTIMDMMKAAQDVGKKMKTAKSAGEKEELMKSVEDQLNAKATKLGDLTKEADAKDEQHGEEYLLGLLTQHLGKWNATQELDAVKQFQQELPVAQELVLHHNASTPLAMQLGQLMDAEKKVQTVAKKVKVVFLQLASSLSK